MRFRGKSSAAFCRAGAYPGGPVAAPDGVLPSLRLCPVPPGGRGDADAGSPALRPCSVHRRGGLRSCSGCRGAPLILPDLPDSLRFPPAGCRPRRPAACAWLSPLAGLPYRGLPGVSGSGSGRSGALRRGRCFSGAVYVSRRLHARNPSAAGAMRSSRRRSPALETIDAGHLSSSARTASWSAPQVRTIRSAAALEGRRLPRPSACGGRASVPCFPSIPVPTRPGPPSPGRRSLGRLSPTWISMFRMSAASRGAPFFPLMPWVGGRAVSAAVLGSGNLPFG